MSILCDVPWRGGVLSAKYYKWEVVYCNSKSQKTIQREKVMFKEVVIRNINNEDIIYHNILKGIYYRMLFLFERSKT